MVAPLASPRLRSSPVALPTQFNREAWNDHPWACPEDDGRQSYPCVRCGQGVDPNRLGDVIHHEQPVHDPIPHQDCVPLLLRVTRRAQLLLLALWMEVLLFLLRSEFALPDDYAVPEEFAPW